MKYKVWVSGWGEKEEDADEVEDFDVSSAVYNYCLDLDENSCFVDGYPDGLEFSVKDENGKISLFVVETEFSPIFWVQQKL